MTTPDSLAERLDDTLLDEVVKVFGYARHCLDGVVSMDDEDEGKDGGSESCQATVKLIDRVLKKVEAHQSLATPVPGAVSNAMVERADLIGELREGIPAYDVTQDGIELHDIDAAETLMANAADFIEAAVQSPPIVGVRALEWRGSVAQTPFGEYSADRDFDDAMAASPWCCWTPTESLGHFATLPDARAAAQADYERRILSSLTPVETQPLPSVEGVELVGDIQFCIDAISHLKEHKARLRLEQMLERIQGDCK